MRYFSLLFLIAAIAGLGIWTLSWIPARAVAILADLLGWLMARWPGPPDWASWFAIAGVFLVQRLISLRFRLTHARVDRKNGSVKSYLVASKSQDSPAGFGVFILVTTVDCVLLILVLRAMHGRAVDWSMRGTFWALAWFAPTAWLYAYWCIEVRVAVNRWFASLLGSRWHASSGFRADHLPSSLKTARYSDAELNVILRGEVTRFAYLGTFLALTVVQGGNPFLFRAVVCFLAADLAFMPLEQILSYLLDWTNDRWIVRLSRQLTHDGCPRRRCQAAEKLAEVGIWAKPVEAAIEQAAQDEDAMVRDAATRALAQLK